MATELTSEETRELISQESFISRNMESFLKVGSALAAIRDRRLYRGTHDTFAEYVVERWAMSKSRAYQLMNLNEVVENLSTIVDAKPTEDQARELHKLPPEQQPEAFKEACEESNGKPTAKAVKKAVEKRKPKEIDPDETSRPQGDTFFEPPTPKEASLEVNTLKEMIENYQDKITLFRWLWESSLPWQKAKYPEFIELWS